MSRNINDSSLANLKHFEGKWKHGKTRTIRVPIALTDKVLAYAKQLDDGDESHSSHTANSAANSSDTSEIDAAMLLNQLKAKSKKSKVTLADVEILLSLLRT